MTTRCPNDLLTSSKRSASQSILLDKGNLRNARYSHLWVTHHELCGEDGSKQNKKKKQLFTALQSNLFSFFLFFGCGRQEFVVETQLHRQTFDFESKTKPKCYVWSGVKSTFSPTSEGYFVICGADGACLFCFEPHQDGGQLASM